jgi:DNA invertase Pin-like site-specific DNA recombinase
MNAKQTKQIVKLYTGGKTMQQVSEIVNVGLSPVKRILNENDIKRRPHGTRELNPKQTARIIQLYNANNSMVKISKMLGIHPGVVRNRLVRNDVAIRAR